MLPKLEVIDLAFPLSRKAISQDGGDPGRGHGIYKSEPSFFPILLGRGWLFPILEEAFH